MNYLIGFAVGFPLGMLAYKALVYWQMWEWYAR